MTFALATVRARWATFLGSFVALGLGVAVLVSTLLVLVAAQPKVPDRYAGAQVLVRAAPAGADPEAFPEFLPWSRADAGPLAGRLAALPGVESAVPDLSFYAQLVRDGRPVGAPGEGQHNGHAWSTAALAPYPIVAGRAPAADGEVALDRDLGYTPGERVTLLTGAGPLPLTVTGTVDGPGFHVADPTADRLAGGVTVIGLRLSPGADPDAVAAAARDVVGDRADVYAGAGRTALEPEFEGRTRWIGAQLLIAMASLAGFVTIFVVASTFAFGIAQRRRELGLLRAVGATPGQVRRIIYGEAVVVGLLAAGGGAVLGAVFGPILGDLMVEAGLQPAGFTVPPDPLVLLGAVALGLTVALLGVWSASRRAGRVRPLEALREAAVDRRPMTPARWIFGVLGTAGGLAVIAGAPALDPELLVNLMIYAAMSLIVGLFLLAPVIIPPVVRLVTRPARGATGELVREGALVAVRRVASTAAPVLVTVGFAVLITGLFEIQSHAFGTQRAERVPADVVVSPDGVPGLSDAVAAAVAAGGGTSAAELPTRIFVTGPAGEAWPVEASGVEPAALAAASVSVSSGSLDDLSAPDALVTTVGTAHRHGWQLGGTAPVVLADGETATLRVVALADDHALPAPVLINRDTARTHDPSALTPVLYAAGITPDRAGVEGLGGLAATPAEYAHRADAEEDRLVRIFLLVLLALSVGYTGIAIANTLLMATTARRRDFAVLRLTGATPGQVARTVAVETTLTVTIGAVLGGLVAFAALVGLRNGYTELLGSPVDLVIPWSTVLPLVATCYLLALLASVVPAHRLAAAPPTALAADRD
ncbi:FtsX-like permease family protein [Polymorphospora sp. NPDC050346]|uniref:ABC transporter permease n=1 Tax=Polymorphospora sp. NPDC050346 TaxID=3155780 RepID=UPI0033D26FED